MTNLSFGNTPNALADAKVPQPGFKLRGIHASAGCNDKPRYAVVEHREGRMAERWHA